MNWILAHKIYLDNTYDRRLQPSAVRIRPTGIRILTRLTGAGGFLGVATTFFFRGIFLSAGFLVITFFRVTTFFLETAFFRVGAFFLEVEAVFFSFNFFFDNHEHFKINLIALIIS